LPKILELSKPFPLLEYLRGKGAKIILISHLGRPAGKRDLKYSLAPIAEVLSQRFGGVKFLKKTIGSDVEAQTKSLQEGEALLLENLRFSKKRKKMIWSSLVLFLSWEIFLSRKGFLSAIENMLQW